MVIVLILFRSREYENKELFLRLKHIVSAQENIKKSNRHIPPPIQYHTYNGIVLIALKQRVLFGSKLSNVVFKHWK